MQPIDVASQFASSIINIAPLGNGHINDTYLVNTKSYPFVLQKINQHVFHNPNLIMANLLMLDQHVKNLPDNQKTLAIPTLIMPLNQANSYFCDDEVQYWRALSYIGNSTSLETLTNLAEAEQVGLALGLFHRMVYALDSSKLNDTLPGFHICPNYLVQYHQIQSATKLAEDDYCAEFIALHHAITNDLEAAKAKGQLVTRIIHGDPKLNNFLFDKTTKHIVSLIDLDTVKPGLLHYDIGDCIRSCSHDISNNSFNLQICQTLLTNYIHVMQDYLSENDYAFLYPAIRLIPFELGLRFYTDYLAGNLYFKVENADDNLHRAIAQFRLCENIMLQEVQIKQFIFNKQKTC